MSSPSGSAAPPPGGVVCNSALSFVASAQPVQPVANLNTEPTTQDVDSGDSTQTDKIIPPGLKELCDACTRLYPDQPNPLQVTTRLKYWLGGEDPLDYISMYWHPGDADQNIPPHWHYISFGLSDLHGDGRVHPRGPGSGFGFELTMRAEAPRAAPPLWPAQLLQATAKYVFATGNKLCAGDHVSWHRPLDGGARGSRVRHLLLARDPALHTCHTRHGSVSFVQLVGCTSRELRAAQRTSGFDVLKLMKDDPSCGGPYLVTNARRRSSVRGASGRAVPAAAATLAGVSCAVRWIPVLQAKKSADAPAASAPGGVEQQIKDTLRRGLSSMSTDSNKGQTVGHMSTDSFEMSSMERALPQLTDTVSSWQDEEAVQYFESVHIFMNAEGASLLPLALDGRIGYGAHFTWRDGECAVTLVPPTVSGALVSPRRALAARGDWLQVLVTKETAAELSRQAGGFSSLARSDSESEGEGPAPAPPPALAAPGLTITVLY